MNLCKDNIDWDASQRKPEEIRAYLCAVRPPQALSRSASDSLKRDRQKYRVELAESIADLQI